MILVKSLAQTGYLSRGHLLDCRWSTRHWQHLPQPTELAHQSRYGADFILSGGFFQHRSNRLHRFLATLPVNQRLTAESQRFLRLDFFIVLIALLIGTLLLSGAVSRVLGESSPLFG